MAKHVLSLEAPDTLNLCQLRLVDTSVYNPDVEVKCPLLQITVPGFNYSVQLESPVVTPGFMLNLTACDLELQHQGCGTTFNTLPDGIYVIRYSVSPNEHVYVEYNHLRMSKALTTYKELLCELDLGACEPDAKTAKKWADLNKIRMYLEAAKAKVEICHEPKKGMELYNYAVKLLGKFECKSCQKF
ncbi:hypothetical protein E6Q11_00435 [Candidatus Dojkabacteria bacterium]|uniref:Uncharacterized protein n=1 Tax=Candidatus Dojkabacteria bacterium TaxID=2099670 RepID=A0A5C7JB18_9BACT|nr:MAG: hypothetical protein E6Q11_00435 [Candidatus Dojkabacteria bacterium]